MESGAVRREETDDDEDTYIYRPRDASVAPREWSTYFPRVAYDRDDRRCGLASALIDAMCCDYNAGRLRTTSRLFDEVGAFFPVFQTDFDDFFAFRAADDDDDSLVVVVVGRFERGEDFESICVVVVCLLPTFWLASSSLTSQILSLSLSLFLSFSCEQTTDESVKRQMYRDSLRLQRTQTRAEGSSPGLIRRVRLGAGRSVSSVGVRRARVFVL